MVTSGQKMVSRLWNQLQTSGTVTRKVSQDCHRASPFTQDRYWALSALQHRRETATQLAHDLVTVSGRRIYRQTVHSRLVEICLYAHRPVWCVPLATSSRKNPLFWS
ncbi:hypothetical protein TNCV_2093691 [Trichonephila clavipes]|nr:hypothetical protein TNCV_2093691 [Trichonephila clavipes]